MPNPLWAAPPGAIAAAAVLLALLSFGGAVRPGSIASSAADTYPCIHAGGGIWEEAWNNSSGAGPTHVFVPLPGHWWAQYNNSTGAAANPGWATMGAGTPESTPGWTMVNLTNDSEVAAAMTTYACANLSGSLPWHYDFATKAFVRDR